MTASTITIIEDNLDFATILKTVLELWGYQVEHFDTLASGAAAVGRRRPAMLILDGQLPDGEGYDLYRRLRRDPATRKLPILMLTVSDDVSQQTRAGLIKDEHLFVGLKPMPLEEIQAIISRVVTP